VAIRSPQPRRKQAGEIGCHIICNVQTKAANEQELCLTIDLGSVGPLGSVCRAVGKSTPAIRGRQAQGGAADCESGGRRTSSLKGDINGVRLKPWDGKGRLSMFPEMKSQLSLPYCVNVVRVQALAEPGVARMSRGGRASAVTVTSLAAFLKSKSDAMNQPVVKG
jgi:hypothetical protein